MVPGSGSLRDVYATNFAPPRPYYVARAAETRLDWVDLVLVGIFLIGLYTNFTIMISAKVPLPSAPSGIAGLILLWRRRDLITQRALVGLLAILALYMISILFSTNVAFLSRRTNGLIQLN
jgi:hypothetical protein